MGNQTRHGGWHSFPVDHWSLGVSLFVMLNGYFPYKDRSLHGLLGKVEAMAVKGGGHC